jgi:hypothetical protein
MLPLMSSLRYANRAKEIKTSVHQNVRSVEHHVRLLQFVNVLYALHSVPRDKCNTVRRSHYENIIKELRTEVAELRAAADVPISTSRTLEFDGSDRLRPALIPPQPSSQQERDALPAELSDTVESIEQALRRIADVEANCIDVNYTRVRQQRLLALGQEEAAASLSAGSSSGVIDPDFDPLLPRASSGQIVGATSLAAQR